MALELYVKSLLSWSTSKYSRKQGKAQGEIHTNITVPYSFNPGDDHDHLGPDTTGAFMNYASFHLMLVESKERGSKGMTMEWRETFE